MISQSEIISPPWRVVLTASALTFAGYQGIYTAPFQISAFQASGMSTGMSSGLVSVNLLGTASGAILSGAVSRVSGPRAGAFASILAMIFSDAGAALDVGAGWLAVLRLIAGLGSGIAFGIANASVAAAAAPEKGFGRVNAITVSAFAIMLAVLPLIIRATALGELFASLAVLGVMLLPVAFAIPGSAGAASLGGKKRMRTDAPVQLLFLGSTLYYLACGGAYALSGQSARYDNMGQATYGIFLSVSAVVGIASSLFAGFTGLRWGRSIPLLVGCLGTMGSLVAMTGKFDSSIMAFGLICYGVFSIYTVTYILGTAASIDETGRVAASLGGFLFIPYAIGPSVMGFGGEIFGWAILPWVVAGISMAGTLLLIALCRRLESEARRRGSFTTTGLPSSTDDARIL